MNNLQWIKLRNKEMLQTKWTSLKNKPRSMKLLMKASNRKNKELLKKPTEEWLKFIQEKLKKLMLLSKKLKKLKKIAKRNKIG
jgi:hypothetical protein